MRYKGHWRGEEIEIPVSFTVENGRLDNFQPPALEDKLFGAAMVAHVNYQNLLRGITDKLPTSIEVHHVPDQEPAPMAKAA